MKTGIVHDGGSSELASGSAALGSHQMDALSQKKHELEAFRLFVGAVQDYAIFLLDTGGVVKSWNLGAERIKGYKALWSLPLTWAEDRVARRRMTPCSRPLLQTLSDESARFRQSQSLG
jgi:PAS domain-containing protein